MTNFEKLIENDKEGIIEMLAANACIDTLNYKVYQVFECDNCGLNCNFNECTYLLKMWLKKEAGV